MSDNPFLQDDAKDEAAKDNPFVDTSAEEVKPEAAVETKKPEAAVETKKPEAAVETKNVNKNTEVANTVNNPTEVKAYTGEGTTSYSNVVTFDTDVKLNIVEKFKLSKDQKAVISFVLFDGKGSPQLQMTHTYYDEPSKTLFRAPNHNKPLLLKVAGKLGEPKIRFATVILRYLTDNRGQLLRPADGQKPYDLLAYVFSTDKFPQFKEIHQRWDLKKYDLLLTCSDEKFQKISIIPAQECMYRKNAQITQDIMVEAREMFEKGLNRFLGKELKDEEIMAIIDDAPTEGAAVTGGAGYNPFTSAAGDQVGNAGGSGDFSDIVKEPGNVKAEDGSVF